MMPDKIDNVIQHAETQQSMAYQAKKQGYQQLQKHIDRMYGDDLLDHYKVRNYAVEVSPSYESSNINLYVHILLDKEYEKALTQVKECEEIEKDFRLTWTYKREIADEIRETVFSDFDMETDIHIKVKTEEQFERLKK